MVVMNAERGSVGIPVLLTPDHPHLEVVPPCPSPEPTDSQPTTPNAERDTVVEPGRATIVAAATIVLAGLGLITYAAVLAIDALTGWLL